MNLGSKLPQMLVHIFLPCLVMATRISKKITLTVGNEIISNA